MNQVDSLVERAAAMHRLGQYRLAEEMYRKALHQQPKHVMAHHMLGCLYLHTNNPLAAIEPLKKAASLDPDFADAHLILGNTLLGLERWAEAEPALRRAMELE